MSDPNRPDLEVLLRLAAAIAARRNAEASASYTASLIAAGTEACARKVGEEAIEVVLAAVAEPNRLAAEAADLLYHLLVLLEERHVPLSEVLAVLASREGRGGHEEKAARRGERG
jgi:phosphoribosyl-ATP pyrophosphohydrolase